MPAGFKGGRGGALLRGAGAVALALALVASTIAAQNGRTVALRIKPRVGDTLYTRFEQEVEMVGTTRLGEVDTTMRMTSSMLMLSHVVVEGRDELGTTVTTVTDSVAVVAAGMGAATPPESLRRAMQGKRVQLRIAPDGSATVLEAPETFTPDVRSVVSGMPSTLPESPVPVGATWEKVMAIPVAGRPGGERAATLRAVYRLDSLSGDGQIAYISMHGTLTRDSAALSLPEGLRITSSGSIVGSMRVDRRRGWWADSHATISLRSTLTPAPGASAKPIHVQTKIVQKMRTGTNR
jgi:hypothetical protein